MTFVPTDATTFDFEFFERELKSFLPDRIYDAHTHLWPEECVPSPANGEPEDFGYGQYIDRIGQIHGGRTTKSLFIPFFPGDKADMIGTANEWVSIKMRVPLRHRHTNRR